jgi:hypothetical protein
MYPIVERANGVQYFTDSSGVIWYLHHSDGLAATVSRQPDWCQIGCAYKEKSGPIANFYISYVNWTRNGNSPGKAQIMPKAKVQQEFPNEYATLIEVFNDCKRRFDFYPYDNVKSIL